MVINYTKIKFKKVMKILNSIPTGSYIYISDVTKDADTFKNIDYITHNFLFIMYINPLKSDELKNLKIYKIKFKIKNSNERDQIINKIDMLEKTHKGIIDYLKIDVIKDSIEDDIISLYNIFDVADNIIYNETIK